MISKTEQSDDGQAEPTPTVYPETEVVPFTDGTALDLAAVPDDEEEVPIDEESMNQQIVATTDYQLVHRVNELGVGTSPDQHGNQKRTRSAESSGILRDDAPEEKKQRRDEELIPTWMENLSLNQRAITCERIHSSTQLPCE